MGCSRRGASRFISPNTPDELHGVELAVGTHEYCSNAWANRGNSLVFNEKNLCADGEGVDACTGDSGGPLVIKGGKQKQDVLIGVVSWGIGCANIGVASGKDSPGVYTKVASHREWIEQFI